MSLPPNDPAAEAEVAPAFSVEKVYVKDLSLEVPHAPEIFLERETPQIELQLRTEGKGLDADLFEVALTVTVNAKVGERSAFLVEVTQAGIFRLRNIPSDNVEPLLAIACPNLLLPFARQAVSEATTRAGFAPVLLQPVNFEALYAGRERQRAEAAGHHEVTIQ
jgi:preprotein translocase subunit SecB